MRGPLLSQPGTRARSLRHKAILYFSFGEPRPLPTTGSGKKRRLFFRSRLRLFCEMILASYSRYPTTSQNSPKRTIFCWAVGNCKSILKLNQRAADFWARFASVLSPWMLVARTPFAKQWLTYNTPLRKKVRGNSILGVCLTGGTL